MSDESSPKPSLILEQAHEQRLQRVETTQQMMASQLASVEAAVQNFPTVLEQNTKLILGEMRLAVQPLAQKLHDHVTSDEVISKEVRAQVGVLEDVVDDQRGRLDDIEGVHQRRRERWDFWKKFLVAVVTGGLAIGGKELVVFVARHF